MDAQLKLWMERHAHRPVWRHVRTGVVHCVGTMHVEDGVPHVATCSNVEGWYGPLADFVRRFERRLEK